MILQIDSDGDAEVDFPPISKPQFVFKSSFDKLKIIDEKDLGDNHGMSKPQQIISLECESEETDEADAIDVYEKTTQDRRDLASYHGLLQTRVKAGDQRGAWRVVSDMQVNGVSPTTATCSILLKGKLESIEEVSRVLVLVDTMEEPMDDVFFAALAEACIGVRRLDVLSKQIDKFQRQGLSGGISAQTYGSLIKAYGCAHDMKRVWGLWSQMLSQQVTL